MAKVNYRLQKRQREEARKKVQLEKQAKRGRVPDAPTEAAEPATQAEPAPTTAESATPPASR